MTAIPDEAVRAAAAELTKGLMGPIARAVLEAATQEIECPACNGTKDAGWENYAIPCGVCGGEGVLFVLKREAP